jgi:hypothetical protein
MTKFLEEVLEAQGVEGSARLSRVRPLDSSEDLHAPCSLERISCEQAHSLST